MSIINRSKLIWTGQGFRISRDDIKSHYKGISYVLKNLSRDIGDPNKDPDQTFRDKTTTLVMKVHEMG